MTTAQQTTNIKYAQQFDANFKNLAFVIPVRIDTEDRLFNLEVVLRFLTKFMPAAEVIIVEQDISSKLLELLVDYPAIGHLFCKTDARFRKADAVNMGVKATNRTYVCMYDADVLIHPDALIASLKAMSRWKWRIVVPFNRIFIDVNGSYRTKVASTLDFSEICRISKLCEVPTNHEISARFLNGGLFITHRETFLAVGGMNKKMISYGWEDTEIFKRFTKLGYHVLHIAEFNLIHLDHSRGQDSQPNEFFDANKNEYLKVCAMSKAELRKYAESELSISEIGREGKLSNLISSQRITNVCGLLRLRAFYNLLKINILGIGPVNFILAKLKS